MSTDFDTSGIERRQGLQSMTVAVLGALIVVSLLLDRVGGEPV